MSYFSYSLIEEIKSYINFDNIDYSSISDEFIDLCSDQIDWTKLCEEKGKDLNDGWFLKKFCKYLDWSYISSNNILDEGYIEEYSNYVDWNYISEYQDMSNDFIRNNFSVLNLKKLYWNEKIDQSFLNILITFE